jgi:O-antigen/teichoic acid export membrane protein
LQPFRHALASLVYTVVSSAVGLGLVIGLAAGVSGILYGQCAGAVAGFIVACFNGAAKHLRVNFHWKRLREMLSYSAPQVFTSIAAYFSLYVDRLLIKELMTLDDVGVYGIGARFGSVVMLVMVGFQSALVPLVFKNYAEPETPDQLARVFLYFMVCAISMILLLCGFSKELVWLFTTPQYYAAWRVIPLIATGIILANMYIFTLGLHLERRTMMIAAINISVALINIAGNMLLIPLFGLTGAATATMVSVLIAFLLYLYFNQRFYPIPFAWKRIVGGTLLGLSFAIVLTGLQASAWTGIAALGGKLTILVLGVTAVMLTGLGWVEVQALIKRFSKKFTNAVISNKRLYKSL